MAGIQSQFWANSFWERTGNLRLRLRCTIIIITLEPYCTFALSFTCCNVAAGSNCLSSIALASLVTNLISSVFVRSEELWLKLSMKSVIVSAVIVGCSIAWSLDWSMMFKFLYHEVYTILTTLFVVPLLITSMWELGTYLLFYLLFVHTLKLFCVRWLS